jgi:UDPglucose 6-dehydrogenase
MEVNEAQKSRLLEKLRNFYGEGGLDGKTFGIWGLAFKPNTDDIREAPSLVVIKHLLASGAKVQAFDPVAMENVKKYYPELKITFTETMYEAAHQADALLIVTEWNEFRTPDLERLKGELKEPVIMDGRNVFELEDVRSAGFYYDSIGREPVDGRS